MQSDGGGGFTHVTDSILFNPFYVWPFSIVSGLFGSPKYLKYTTFKANSINSTFACMLDASHPMMRATQCTMFNIGWLVSFFLALIRRRHNDHLYLETI